MCSDLVVFILTDNFGLFTEIAVCNFLRGLAIVLVRNLFILPAACVYAFSYGALCLRMGHRQCAIEMCKTVIINLVVDLNPWLCVVGRRC